MRVLVIGSGGREHALVWKIGQSARVTHMYCAPGNAGIETAAECVPIQATDIQGLAEFAENKRIDLTVVGPEQPLADGIVDVFDRRGLTIFGPTKTAAKLEWSKTFAKDFMRRHGIPSASYHVFTRNQREEARLCVMSSPLPLVLKADGLAAGKGVAVCTNREEAQGHLHTVFEMNSFGSAGEKVVIEEYLEGEEASVLAVCDGKNFVTLVPAQDHKRAFDGDRGKNTGGMGAYAPAPVVTREVLETVERTIIEPTVMGMREEGNTYSGCLYVGLMITSDGPKVLEYNCRFGDPEAQGVVPLYGDDFIGLLYTCSRTELSTHGPQPTHSLQRAAVCVVLASGGYPDQYATGKEISGLEQLESFPNIVVFHAGTRRENGKLVTSGGRVLGVTAICQTLAEALNTAYGAVEKISFEGMHYRHDIGRKALAHAWQGREHAS